MREKVRSYMKISIISLVFVALIFYAYLETKELINGPEIDIKYPTNGLSIRREVIEISGKTKNSSSLSLNGKQILVDSDGNFSEKLAFASGYNSVFIEAKDRLGKTQSAIINLVLNKNAAAPKGKNMPLTYLDKKEISY